MELDHDYWKQRWEEGSVGWHQTFVTPWLKQYWPRLQLPAASRVLVPFSGKSLDLLWLAKQGYAVLGVELSPLAIADFFAEHELRPVTTDAADGRHHRAGAIEIIEGDLFAVAKATLATCTAVFDRGAMVAQTATQRQRYQQEIYGALPVGSRGLLLTIDYPQAEREGPPFAVTARELEHNLPAWQMVSLERRDLLADMADGLGGGLTALHADAFLLTKATNPVKHG